MSSRLISETSLTADRLVVIGHGRLIAETSVADCVGRSGGGGVRLVTPDADAFTALMRRAGASMGRGEDGALTIGGLTAPAIGDLAARDALRIHGLAEVTASLEDAFMELTRDEVELHPSTMPGALADGEEGR